MSLARGLRLLPRLFAPRRNFAPRRFATLPPEVVIFPDSDTVVCWHPEQEVPYECSLPLYEEPAAQRLLKVSEKEVRAVFSRRKSNKEIAVECAKLTYTTMHPWFPRSRNKRAKKTESDRPYL